MPDLWDSPDTGISTPPWDETEGYPVYSGYVAHPTYEQEGFSTKREGKIWTGVQYYDGATPLEGTLADWQALEGGLYNKFRIVMYHAYHRLDRLIGLLFGPRMSNYVSEGMGAINFSESFPFSASGSGTSITIFHSGDWIKPWALKGTRSTPTCIVPGVWVNGGGVWARVTDVVFGHYSSTLTLDRAMNAAGGVTIVIENKARGYPILPLEIDAADVMDPPKCRYDVKANHHAYSSFAALFPSAPVSAGIDGARFCVKMDQDGVDLSKFKGGSGCNNVDCPFYAVHQPGVDDSGMFSKFFVGKGDWTRQISISVSSNANFRVGRDGWPGLFLLIGMRVGCHAEEYSLNVPWKTYVGQGGVLYFSDGTLDSRGLEVFKTFHQAQRDRVALGNTETDNLGILSLLAGAETWKRDPAAPGVLQARDGWTPGFIFEKALGIRRGQQARFDTTSVTPTGDGQKGVQRLVPARHTSPTFVVDPPESDTVWGATETTVTRLAVPRTVDGFTWHVEFRIPQIGRKVDPATPAKVKMTATIEHMTLENNVLNVQFQLATRTLYYNNPAYHPLFNPLEPTIDSTFQCGGNVVCSDAAHLVDHPGSWEGIGDQQRGLFPGDRLTFTSGDLAGHSVICIGAKAFAGAKVPGQAEPHPSVAGIPEYVRQNMHRRDQGRFRVEGATYDAIRTFIMNATEDSYPISCTIDQGAVIPVDQNVVLKRVQGETVTVLDPSTYQIDRATGVIRVNTTGWSLATNYRLHAEFDYLMNTVYTHPVEEALVLLNKLETVRANTWARASFSSTGNDVLAQTVLVYPPNEMFPERTTYGYHTFGVPREETLSLFGNSPYAGHSPVPNDQYVLVEDAGSTGTGGQMGMDSFIRSLGVDGTLFFTYRTFMRRLGMDEQLRRLSPDWISEAKGNLVIRGSAYRRDYYFHEGEMTEAIDSTTILDSPDLAVQIFEATGDPSRYDLKEVGLFVTKEATRTYNSDLDEWEYAATVDCTELVKIVVGSPEKTFLVAPRVLSPNAISDVIGLAKSFVDWRSHWSGENWVWDLSYYRLEFSSYELNPIYIKIAPGALTTGAMHFDNQAQAIGANLSKGF